MNDEQQRREKREGVFNVPGPTVVFLHIVLSYFSRQIIPQEADIKHNLSLFQCNVVHVATLG